MKPLSGIRVIDLSRFISGPYCTMVLGDLGAEIIKVEMPKGGDGTRRWSAGAHLSDNPYFLAVNRNKRSVCIDLKHADGRELVAALVRNADVLVSNFKAGTLDELGLGYDVLSAFNPRLIDCEISGFGQTGPSRDRAAFDFTIQAESGLMTLIGEPDGPPMKIGVPLMDVLTALMACNGIQSALLERQRSGRGTRVTTSMLETALACMPNVISDYLVGGLVPERWGNGHPNLAPYETYQATDGWFALGVATEPQWRRFCALAGCNELADDQRFDSNGVRLKNRSALNVALAPVLARRSRAEWMHMLAAVGIPCAPINTVPEVLVDPQVQALDIVQEVQHPVWQTIRMVRSPISFDGAHLPIACAPPRLGADTDAVLAEVLGLDAAAIAAQRASGAIG